jgi:hypothetical protein
MKHSLCIIVLLSGLQVFAKEKRFQGSVIDAAAFKKINSYCVDTHNVPSRQVKVIDQFVSEESKPKGLLTRLPWHCVETCEGGGADALLRIEFSYNRPPTFARPKDIKAVLLVLLPSSPTPVYETQALPFATGDQPFAGQGYSIEQLQRNALDSVIRILIHDCGYLPYLRTAALASKLITASYLLPIGDTLSLGG